jgi:uncharacterized membrane protein YhaH (DUF805 family)
MNSYLTVLKKYAVFSGRARRQEYWMYFLFTMIFVFVCGFVDFILNTYIFIIVYLLATVIPSLAVSVRRLHDTGRSGWWLLISFVPFIGSLVLLIFTLLDGNTNENEYGSNPKHIASRY